VTAGEREDGPFVAAQQETGGFVAETQGQPSDPIDVAEVHRDEFVALGDRDVQTALDRRVDEVPGATATPSSSFVSPVRRSTTATVPAPSRATKMRCPSGTRSG